MLSIKNDVHRLSSLPPYMKLEHSTADQPLTTLIVTPHRQSTPTITEESESNPVQMDEIEDFETEDPAQWASRLEAQVRDSRFGAQLSKRELEALVTYKECMAVLQPEILQDMRRAAELSKIADHDKSELEELRVKIDRAVHYVMRLLDYARMASAMIQAVSVHPSLNSKIGLRVLRSGGVYVDQDVFTP